MIHRVTGQSQTSLTECQECLQYQEANGKREDKEGQRPVGSERGGDVIEQGGLRPLDPEIHKSPAIDKPNDVLSAP